MSRTRCVNLEQQADGSYIDNTVSLDVVLPENIQSYTRDGRRYCYDTLTALGFIRAAKERGKIPSIPETRSPLTRREIEATYNNARLRFPQEYMVMSGDIILAREDTQEAALLRARELVRAAPANKLTMREVAKVVGDELALLYPLGVKDYPVIRVYNGAAAAAAAAHRPAAAAMREFGVPARPSGAAASESQPPQPDAAAPAFGGFGVPARLGSSSFWAAADASRPAAASNFGVPARPAAAVASSDLEARQHQQQDDIRRTAPAPARPAMVSIFGTGPAGGFFASNNDVEERRRVEQRELGRQLAAHRESIVARARQEITGGGSLTKQELEEVYDRLRKSMNKIVKLFTDDLFSTIVPFRLDHSLDHIKSRTPDFTRAVGIEVTNLLTRFAGVPDKLRTAFRFLTALILVRFISEAQEHQDYSIYYNKLTGAVADRFFTAAVKKGFPRDIVTMVKTSQVHDYDEITSMIESIVRRDVSSMVVSGVRRSYEEAAASSYPAAAAASYPAAAAASSYPAAAASSSYPAAAAASYPAAAASSSYPAAAASSDAASRSVRPRLEPPPLCPRENWPARPSNYWTSEYFEPDCSQLYYSRFEDNGELRCANARDPSTIISCPDFVTRKALRD